MRLTRRQLLRRTLVSSAALPIGALIAACGQPVPTQTAPNAGGAAPLAVTATPEGTTEVSGTPGTPAIPPDSSQTATAVALVPTMPGPKVPAPTGTQVFFTPTPHPPFPTVAQPQTMPTPRPEDPYVYTVSSQRPRDIPTVLSATTVIVLGTVTTVGPAQWSTDDGRRPTNPRHPPPGTLYSIFRPVEFAAERIVYGQTGLSSLVLHAFGGQVGQDSMRYTSDNAFYEFVQGERAVVFLMSPVSPMPTQWRGQTLWTLIDHYTVTSDGRAQASHRTVPLQQLLDEIAAAER
jgi:hypothetical protein